MFKANTVRQLISELDDTNKLIRQKAEHILINVGQFVLDDLIHELENQDEETSCAVAAIIVHIGNPALDTLIQALEKTHDPKSQKIMIEILGQIGDGKAIEPLRKILRSDDELLSNMAFDAIGEIFARQYRELTQMNTRTANSMPFLQEANDEMVSVQI